MPGLEWVPHTPSALERDWPVLLLVGCIAAWGMMNALVLGYSAATRLFVLVLALSLSGVGIVWIVVIAWNHLHRPKA